MRSVKRFRPLNRRPHVMTVRMTPVERKLLLASRRPDENISDTIRRLMLTAAAAERSGNPAANAAANTTTTGEHRP